MTENKKMRRLIIPTGYMGSGSSALTDLISEFEDYEAPLGSFEFVFMHCPNGVFDLEDKLLLGNNALRSDEALRSFSGAMEELDRTPFWWVGEYRKNVSRHFMDITCEYVQSLTQFRSESFWYYQERRGWKAFPRLAFNKILRTISSGNIWPKKPLEYEGMMFAMPTPEEFYEASRIYVDRVVSEVPCSVANMILDQLILPFNAWRFENYFPSNAECFIVDRDPRDVFLSNKYIWTRSNAQVPYPLDARMFVAYYKRLRQLERPTENPHVHRIQFEELVYRYDETVARIKDILGIDEASHQQRREGFDPQRSINNTQLFLLPEFEGEAGIIAEGLSEYLYDFPFERKPEAGEIF